VIVPGGDAQALQRVLAGLLSDRERLGTMGAAARRYALTRSATEAFEAMWQMWREQPRRQRPADDVFRAGQANAFMHGPLAGTSPVGWTMP
jgi:hypothetical protein